LQGAASYRIHSYGQASHNKLENKYLRWNFRRYFTQW